MSELTSLEILQQWDRYRRSVKPVQFEEHWQSFIENRRFEEAYLLAKIRESTESPIEAIVYLALWNWGDMGHCLHGLRIWPQKQIDKYRVDFYIEYRDKKIIVECDGHDFHEKTKRQAERDKKRDRFFASRGYIVLRYTGSEICSDPGQIIRDIEAIVDEEQDE
jgi:very-short-patch-repair endonuclease